MVTALLAHGPLPAIHCTEGTWWQLCSLYIGPWCEGWSGQFILCHSDNSTVVIKVSSLHACNPLTCNMLHCLTLFEAKFDFCLPAVHVPGGRRSGPPVLWPYGSTSREFSTDLSLPLPGAAGSSPPSMSASGRLDMVSLESQFHAQCLPRDPQDQLATAILW